MIFNADKAVGFFLGLAEGGLEFGAELTLNYDSDYQNRPMLGQFVIVELERPDEAVLGRITAVTSHGRLASAAGEDLGARTVDTKRPMPEDLKKQFLRYKCSVRLLGLLRRDRRNGNSIVFAPSHRRLPHLGAKVAFAEGDVLQAVASAREDHPGKPIGFLAFGEFVYAEGHEYAAKLGPEFQALSPIIEPRFDAEAMVARRTAVFARSGFGKSNLLKILFARLYDGEYPPTISRRGKEVKVGTLVLDPDGDYFWPGGGRHAPPGLCDVPQLRDKIVLVTDRGRDEAYYDEFKVTRPRLDLREFGAGLVLGCVLTGERLDQRGTQALMRMPADPWRQLVDAAWLDHTQRSGLLTDRVITSLCRLGGRNPEAVAGGIRNTMLDLVAKLHDPTSQLRRAVMNGLAEGKLVIIDLSLMRGRPATNLSAILLRHLFEWNVEEHTKPDDESKAIPVILLIEEAQKVLEGSESMHGPFIEWVKEGRKYDLGAVLVTQQPGAIEDEIISQSDSFFVFHLVSGRDLNALRHANGHFSEDILASLLNEPIEGQGVFWSSAGAARTTYPIPFRAYNFGDLHSRLPDKEARSSPSSPNYAARLQSKLGSKAVPVLEDSRKSLPVPSPTAGIQFPNKKGLKKGDYELSQELTEEKGADLARLKFPVFIAERWLKSRSKQASRYLPRLFTVLFGLYGYGWRLEWQPNKDGRPILWVIKIDPDEGRRRLDAGDDPLVEEMDDELPIESGGGIGYDFDDAAED